MIDPAELEYLAAEYVLGTLDEQECEPVRHSDAALRKNIEAAYAKGNKR